MAEHRFKLVADWEPAGDQPKAIDELASALQSGEKRLTLLGATGTGKSLDAEEPILLFRRGHDGGWMSECVPIGALVDGQLEEASTLEQVGDTEISRENQLGYHVLSFNPRSCKAELKPITAFVRHEAPSVMYRVKLDCGRESLITGDHNLWVLRDGSLRLIETHEARSGDYIPLPEAIPSPESDLEDINLLELLRDEKLFVDAGPIVKAWVEEYGITRVRAEFKRHLGEARGRSKLRLVTGDLPARGILVDVFLRIASGLGSELTRDQLDLVKVGPRLDGTMLPARFRLTKQVLRLIGHYIAEGNCQRGYFMIAGRSDVVREQIVAALTSLGVRYSVRDSIDISVGSRLMAAILSKLCGPDARTKHLPAFWGALSARQLGWLLQAYFEGDGWVENCAITCATASRRLASDLAYALFRFGIWARINTKFKRAVNSAHIGGTYYQVTVHGQEALGVFTEHIGFLSERKREALKANLGSQADANVDVVPGCGAAVKSLRESLHLHKNEIESLKPAVGYLDRWVKTAPQGYASAPAGNAADRVALTLNESWNFGKPHLNHQRARRLVGTYRSIDRERARKELDKNSALGRVRWSRVVGAEEVPYTKAYVYDVSVADNETFLGGFGGMFLHNTYTMAGVIERLQKPTLVIAHNKTLAAQLCSEFRSFFPENAVHYFISYYDYYQPEAYIPRTDTYIEKDSSINDEIDRLRHAATSALFERRDVIIVASVSCIYGLGSPEDYVGLTLSLKHGDFRDRDSILRKLVGIQYERNDVGFTRGTFRVRGDVIEIVPVYEEHVIRIELFGDEVDRILELDPVTGEIIEEKDTLTIYPATHFITSEEKMKRAINTIQEELRERLAYFKKEGKLLEAQRLEQRTMYDLEMLEQVGVCQGIENYSRHLTGREPGEAPATLLDYFPGDFLMFIDESHQTIPQIGAMYRGDRSRKETLVEYGFRLPSALDNRPLRFEEFEERMNQVVFVSATPGGYEQKVSSRVVEQIIRPTGLVDPEVEVRPIQGQIDDLLDEIQQVVARGERVLVTTLTKKMAEDLTDYFTDMGVRVRYLHSEIQSLERIEILRDLRLGAFDVLVGINLLREGLDLPEVSLVAILDADKEGFLRSDTSLIQTIGRAARNVNGRVIMYADNVTGSMQRAIDETNRRRAIQLAYNEEHGITPETVRKKIHEAIRAEDGETADDSKADVLDKVKSLSAKELAKHIQDLEAEMFEAAKKLEFERAAELRDEIEELRSAMLEFTG